ERADFRVFAAAERAELHHARELLAEAHAARAVDAARHERRDERADILIRHHALRLVVARIVLAVAERLILQRAFAALVADRAVERMVEQQKLHHGFLRLARL